MKKILVIEDEPSFLKLLEAQLTNDGFEIISAQDGKKGLETAISERPDLIFLDLLMPVMDGLTTLTELRKDSWGETVKVIILTNLEPDKDILDKLLIGKPSLYLVKSNIKLSDLKGKILNILS